MKELIINVERTGFPIKIQGIEFFFDTSVEGLENYEQNYLKAIDSIENMKETGNALADRKKVLKEAYDIILGVGSFEKIYKKISDVIALTNAFFLIVEEISKRTEELVKEQMDKTDSLVEEYEQKALKLVK